jgi:hypothetical protein
VVGSTREELLDLKDAFWWQQHLRHEQEGTAAFDSKQDSRAFRAFLDSFEALTKNGESGMGGSLCSYADPIEELEKVVRELKYRPDVDQLSRLHKCLKQNDIPSALRPGIDRLKQALDAVNQL